MPERLSGEYDAQAGEDEDYRLQPGYPRRSRVCAELGAELGSSTLGTFTKGSEMSKQTFKQLVEPMEYVEPCQVHIGFDLDKCRYEIQEGQIVLIFDGVRAPDCPQVLAGEVVEWCEQRRMNPEILLDAMLEAAYKEQNMELLRQAMV